MSKRDVSEQELWALRSKEKGEKCYKDIALLWDAELKMSSKPSFKSVLLKYITREFLWCLFFNILWAVLTVTSASYFVINILDSLNDSTSPLTTGVAYALVKDCPRFSYYPTLQLGVSGNH